MSVMSQTYSIIIDRGISSPGHGKEVVGGIALEHFSAAPQADINSSTLSRPRHAVFHSFYLVIANRMPPLLLHTAND